MITVSNKANTARRIVGLEGTFITSNRVTYKVFLSGEYKKTTPRVIKKGNWKHPKRNVRSSNQDKINLVIYIKMTFL